MNRGTYRVDCDFSQKVARVTPKGAGEGEEVIADRACAADTVARALDVRSDARCDPIEGLAIAFEIALWVVPRTNEQRCVVERKIVSTHDLAEPG